MASAVRARIAELLDARGDAPGRKAVTALLLTAIAAATIFGLFATLPDLDAGARVRLRLLGGGAVVVFTFEYLLRLWIAPSRRRYALSFLGVVDLLSALPFWLHLAGNRTADSGDPGHAAGPGEAGALCAGLRPCRGGIPCRAARAVCRAHRSRRSAAAGVGDHVSAGAERAARGVHQHSQDPCGGPSSPSPASAMAT